MTGKRKRRGRTLPARWTFLEILEAAKVPVSWTESHDLDRISPDGGVPRRKVDFDDPFPRGNVPPELLRGILELQGAIMPKNPGGQPGCRKLKPKTADMLAYASLLPDVDGGGRGRKGKLTLAAEHFNPNASAADIQRIVRALRRNHTK